MNPAEPNPANRFHIDLNQLAFKVVSDTPGQCIMVKPWGWWTIISFLFGVILVLTLVGVFVWSIPVMTYRLHDTTKILLYEVSMGAIIVLAAFVGLMMSKFYLPHIPYRKLGVLLSEQKLIIEKPFKTVKINFSDIDQLMIDGIHINSANSRAFRLGISIKVGDRIIALLSPLWKIRSLNIHVDFDEKVAQTIHIARSLGLPERLFENIELALEG